MGAKQKKHQRLTGEQRRWIIRLLAEWCGPQEIAEGFESTFGRKISHSLVQHYRDSEKWRPEIERARTALLHRISDIPIASKYWRILQRYKLFESENRYRITRYAGSYQGDPGVPIEELPLGELRQLLLDAAREMGDLTERHEVSLPDGLTVHTATLGRSDTGGEA